jgi:hypothetical protein
VALTSPPPPPPSARLQSGVENLSSSTPADSIASAYNSTSPGACARRNGEYSANHAATTEKEFTISDFVDEGKSKLANDSLGYSDLTKSIYHEDVPQVAWLSNRPKPVELVIAQHDISSSQFEANVLHSSTNGRNQFPISNHKTPVSLLTEVQDNPTAVNGEGTASASDSDQDDVQYIRTESNEGLDKGGHPIKDFSCLPFAQVRHSN